VWLWEDSKYLSKLLRSQITYRRSL
jgi:hypothetical protein